MAEWQSTVDHSPPSGSPSAMGGWQNTADHAESPVRPSPMEQIGKSVKNQAKGLFDLVSAIVDPEMGMKIGNGIIDASVASWQKAKESYSKGNYKDALAHALNSTPLVGHIIDKAANDIHEGRPFEAGTDLLLAPALAKGSGLLGDAIAGAPGAAVRSAVAAGAPEFGAGAAKIAGGAALDAMGAPYHLGTALGVREGFGNLANGVRAAAKGGKEGLAKFRAEQGAAASSPETQIPPMPVGIPATETLTGRKVGGIANQTPEIPVGTPPIKTPTLAELADFAKANKLGPLRGNESALRKLYTAAMEADAARAVVTPAEPAVATTGEMTWDPQRGHVYKATGTAQPPKVETIPTANKPTLPEQFAQKARDLRSANTDKLADALKDTGIEADSLMSVLTDVRNAAQLRALAKQAGIAELPADLTRTVQELREKMKGTK